MGELLALLPPEAVGLVLTLALSLLIGLEREEHAEERPETHFGGVRTFPLIGVGGFLLVAAFPSQGLPFAVGLLVLGLLLTASYRRGLKIGDPGLTTEFAALVTFTLGGAVAAGLHWIAVAAGVVAVILLQEKTRLEDLATRLPRLELRTLARFLVLTAVILPAVPDQSFTRFELNPFKFWLVVSAVCGVSYASYLLQRWIGRRHGLLVAGILGGAYSSTVTTVVLARQAKQHPERAVTAAGGIIAATGVMYLRLWLLVRLFSPAIATTLVLPFVALGIAGIGVGAVVCHRGRRDLTADEEERTPVNPLEITSALTFAALFLAVLVITRMVSGAFGDTGVLVMAAVMGAADVDPFILGLTQVAGDGVSFDLAALAIVIAAAANNLMKGIYAASFGGWKIGRPVLAALLGLAVASLVLVAVAA